jgi:anti-anti-sigma factor
MEIRHSEIAPATVVVTITGKVMLGTDSEKIVDLVGELLREGKRTIIFDISAVTRIDSTGIGRFISSYREIAAAGGEMRIAGAAGYLFQAFHICQLDTIFRFFPDLEAASKAS